MGDLGDLGGQQLRHPLDSGWPNSLKHGLELW